MKVFISYSTALDQIIALRLQTMAAVYGLTVYVPPATTRYAVTSELIPEVQKQLEEADVVLAVITHAPAVTAVSEIRWAQAKGRLLIPIVSINVPPEYYGHFPWYFVVDPADPSLGNILKFLAEKHQTEKGKTVLFALAALAAALLLLGADSQ